MRIDRYLHLVPDIERRIADLKPDAIVFGMGPTGWLLPWIDQKLLHGVRMWTCHDGCRIYPANDVVLMDHPSRGLHPCSDRYRAIVDSRPSRIWCYERAWEHWKSHLDKAVLGVVTVQKFAVWHPRQPPSSIKPKLGRVEEKSSEVCPDTVAISPTGTAMLAWAQGARRIGILGVDMLKEHGHSSWDALPQVDAFFHRAATAAHEAGGAITNLSPVTSLKAFAQWTAPSQFGSAQISGSATQEPSKSLNTASSSTLPAA